jgi:hypothetical protein
MYLYHLPIGHVASYRIFGGIDCNFLNTSEVKNSLHEQQQQNFVSCSSLF